MQHTKPADSESVYVSSVIFSRRTVHVFQIVFVVSLESLMRPRYWQVQLVERSRVSMHVPCQQSGQCQQSPCTP